MTKVVLRWMDADGELRVGDVDCLPDCLAADWVWADLTAPDPELIEQFRARFDLHPLAVEDLLHTQHRAKLDIYPGGLFMAWLTPRHRSGDGVVVDELDIMFGAKYLITSHAVAIAAIDKVAEDTARSMRSGSDWTLHAIIDLLVDSTLPLVDAIGEDLNTIEDAMLDSSPRQEDLRKLHQTRRQLVRLHRIVAPERDVLHALARERDIVSEEAYRSRRQGARFNRDVPGRRRVSDGSLLVGAEQPNERDHEAAHGCSHHLHAVDPAFGYLWDERTKGHVAES